MSGAAQDETPAAPVEDGPNSNTPPEVTPEAVRRQREHIEGLTGEDPLRGGVAD